MRDLASYYHHQVFLNFPFDEGSVGISYAMHFAVIAAGLVPVCAKDLTAPDRPRLQSLIYAIDSCKYSAHDFSKYRGEGEKNFSRFNMPVEMGMALYNAMKTQRSEHRCAFFVTSPHEYRIFASDLAGLDPYRYEDDCGLVSIMYEWLRDTVRAAFVKKPTSEIVSHYREFTSQIAHIEGSGGPGSPSHHEAQELMYQLCTQAELWDWRANLAGRQAFPEVPLKFSHRVNR